MKAICAWCGLVLGERPGSGVMTTHGMCPTCAETLRAGIARVGQDPPARIIGEMPGVQPEERRGLIG